ncbi:MAG TPA: iron-containing alcohol dehydrogenase [Anaerolineales bacterium]|nr:iron-containing alcohol dehydrogenase [Anaerolineales bacterium]
MRKAALLWHKKLTVEAWGLIDKFRYLSYAQEVVFVLGSMVQLSESVERFAWKKLLLCTNHSMQVQGHVDSIKDSLGERLVATFDRVQPHVQDTQVDEVLGLALEHEVDAIIGMGGGSSIGMAKAVSHALAAAPPKDKLLIPVIAIPTTYAGSEMTAVYGITHSRELPPRKVTVNDPKIAPRLVIYDPQFTLDLPPEMTASTGINALAHCIEALYSRTRNPLSTAAAIDGVRHIKNALLICYQRANNLEARTEMLLGAHLAGLSLASVSMGLHHGLCHVLGGTANVPHGIANGIILPHAIRFNADVTAPQLLPAAEAMGCVLDGHGSLVAMEALAQKIFDLVSEMNLPQRLRDAGGDLKESDLPQLAQIAFQNRTVQNNPKPITEPAEIETLLRAAW